MTRQIKTG